MTTNKARLSLILISFFLLIASFSKVVAREFTPAPIDGPQITLVTELPQFSYIDIKVESDNRDLWVDLNGNKQFDAGEDFMGYFQDGNPADVFVLDKQELVIYGDVKKLHAYDISLSKVDLTKAPNLVYVNLNGNKLQEINLTNNVNLEEIRMAFNSFNSPIDFSNNTKLVTIEATSANIKEVKLERNNVLKEVFLSLNKIESINLSNNINLTDVYLYNNQLKELDVHNNKELVNLSVGVNPITSLDLSQNKKLVSLVTEQTLIESIDLSNLIDLESYLGNYNCMMKLPLDFSNNKKIQEINCAGNNQSNIIFGDNTLSSVNVILLSENKLENSFFDELADKIDVNQNFDEADIEDGLPPIYGVIYIVNSKGLNEGNYCTKDIVKKFADKKWTLADLNGDIENATMYGGVAVSVNKISSNRAPFSVSTTSNNPNILNVSFAPSIVGEKVIIYTTTGEKVLGSKIEALQQDIYIGHLPHGVYLIHAGDCTLKFTR